MKTQIKIVKRKQDAIPTDSETAFESKPVEPSTREITIVVKKWVAELKERKGTHNQSSKPLEVK